MYIEKLATPITITAPGTTATANAVRYLRLDEAPTNVPPGSAKEVIRLRLEYGDIDDKGAFSPLTRPDTRTPWIEDRYITDADDEYKELMTVRPNVPRDFRTSDLVAAVNKMRARKQK